MGISKGRIWIQGAGELASGVAFRLFRAGYGIIMAEISNPMAVRRLVSFCEVVYEGDLTIEGVPGRLVEPDLARYRRDQVTVVIDPAARVLATLGADAVVDARMTKSLPRPLPSGTAPIIGLGPGFVCGKSADLVIETHRQARLGEVISQGEAAANTGVPGMVGGETARRVVYAPVSGHLTPCAALGDLVEEGQVLGTIGDREVKAPLTGRLRGLVHPRAELFQAVKVADVDPRGSGIDPYLVSDKALAIAGGVLEALLRLRVDPARDEDQS